MTAAAIAGSYSDFKLVKSRSVAQIVVEVPIEKAEEFLKVFGVPQPGAERPVALALMNVQKEPEKPKQSWESMSYAQRSGILRNDKRFQEWLGVSNADDAAEHIRKKCGVDSCSQIDGFGRAMAQFDHLWGRYRTATGQETWHP